MRTLAFIAALVLACGCSSSSNGAASPDSGAGGDDAAAGGEGGSALDGGEAGIDGETGGPTDAGADAPPADGPAPCGSTGVSCTTHQAVAARLVLPTSSSDFAIDLDGDGNKDNQYGRLVQALSSQGFDAQASEDATVTQGKGIVLLDEASVDQMLATDPGAAVARVLSGVAQANPDYSGMGTFTVDTSVPPGSYQGPIVSGVFTSPDAPTVTSPPVLHVPIATLSAPTTAAALPLYAAHLTVTATGGKPVSAQVNGAYKESDIQTILFPAIAADLTQTVKANPTSSQSMQIEQLFDVGDGNGGSCTNPDGTKSAPNDGVIGTCEVAGNTIVQSVFAPDVQLFDATGNYHPTPGGAQKDAMSVGFELSLVGAHF